MRPGGQEARRPGQEDGVQEEDPLQEQGRPQPGGAAPGGGGGHLVQQGQALQGEDQQPSRQQCTMGQSPKGIVFFLELAIF